MNVKAKRTLLRETAEERRVSEFIGPDDEGMRGGREGEQGECTHHAPPLAYVTPMNHVELTGAPATLTATLSSHTHSEWLMPL